MNFETELKKSWEDMKYQKDIYKPTSFWYKISERIKESLIENGIEGFRSNELCLSFFVPTYGPPFNGLKEKDIEIILDLYKKNNYKNLKAYNQLNNDLNGYSSAYSDYRVLLASDIVNDLPDLSKFSESNFGKPKEHFIFEERYFSRSSLNYLLGLSMLKRYIHFNNIDYSSIKNVLEIGGGFGTLGEIISQAGINRWKYIDVDIPPMSSIAKWYLSQAIGDDRVKGYCDTYELNKIDIDNLTNVSVLLPWQLSRLRGNIDLFVNFISFQEMEPNVVENYLSLVTGLNPTWILLRNLREGKQKKTELNSVGVINPILGNDYNKMIPNYELVERSTIPFGYLTIDKFHSEILLFKKKIN